MIALITHFAFCLHFRPVGTGIVKAVVNVFGARQYHPILQRSMIESYYVQFYMIINVGAVAGCIIIPVTARNNITAAYTIPFVLLLVALVFFVAGSKRYVHVVPGQHGNDTGNGSVDVESRVADMGTPSFVDVAKISALLIPFSIVYGQCPTTCKRVSMGHTFLLTQYFCLIIISHNVVVMVQGAVMKPFLGIIEAPSMDICDCK
jgi:hypothetical protein